MSVLVLDLSVAPETARADVRASPTRTFVTDGTVQTIVPTASAIYIGGNFSRVAPRTGPAVGIDASTGRSTGLAPVAGGSQTVWAVAPDGSGGVYVGGDFTRVGAYGRRNLAHILPNGRVDAGFDPHPPGVVRALAVSGQTVFVGGNFTSIAGQPRNRLAALDAGTGQATGWNPGANNVVLSLAVSGQTVYAGGAFTSIGGQPRNRVAALDRTTGQATGWNPSVQGNNAQVGAIARSASAVYIGGHFASVGGETRRDVAALDPATGHATSWDPNAGNNSATVNALAVSGDRVYAGGSFTSIGGQPRHYLAALDDTTGQATAWDPNPNSFVKTLAASGQTIYAGGYFGSIGGQERRHLAAFDATSGDATSWDPDVHGHVLSLAVYGETVYVGGEFASIGGHVRHNLAALDPTTGAVTSWNPDVDGYVWALAASGQVVYVGGYFHSIGGHSRDSIGAVDATTGDVTGWDPGPVRDPVGIPTVGAIAVSGPTVYVGGEFKSIGGQPRNNIAAIGTASGNVTSWDPDALWNGQLGGVAALAPDGPTIYVGGGFNSIGGQPRNEIAALDRATGEATPWNPDAEPFAPGYSSVVGELAVSGNTVYAGGLFASIGGQTRHGIAALDATTGQATGWDPNALWQGQGGNVAALALDGSTVYAGGGFGSIGGQPRADLAALDAASGAATAWNPKVRPADLYGTIRALAVGPDGSLWVGGRFSGFPSGAQASIARFAPQP